MIKGFYVYSIPDGAKGDDFWDYHKCVHARDVLKVTSNFRTKYVLNRVKKTLYGCHNIFGIVEIVWLSEELRLKDEEAVKTARLSNGKTISEDFRSRLQDDFHVLVDEYDVIKAETGKPSAVSGDGRGCKRFTIYSIPDGANGDDFWRYHSEGHARDVWNATRHLHKVQYMMNRVKKTLYGHHDIFCFVETKWDSDEVIAQDGQILKTIRLANGMNIQEDFLSQVKKCLSILVEEYDVIASNQNKA